MNKLAKTKIIATIGPSSWNDETLTQMHNSGMSFARINASFAKYDELKKATIADSTRAKYMYFNDTTHTVWILWGN